MKILAIESSCDETAAAVVADGRTALSSVVNSQVAEHRIYGGVVPEIASRRHTENIVPVVQKALDDARLYLQDMDAVAVTAAPGLIGALLVGVNYAKGLALASGKPLIPVHHLRGHIAANYLAHPELEPPFLCLVASGGHSHIVEVIDYTTFRVLGRTRDDAAGEAFDKAARAMGFPYPGGVHIEEAAKRGDPGKYKLPRPKVADAPLDFSFSGLKTAVINLMHHAKQVGEPVDTDSLAVALQAAICDALVGRVALAARAIDASRIAAAGGVCANGGLRQALKDMCRREGYALYMPPVPLCGDNAAMIGSQAYYESKVNPPASMDLNAQATMDISEPF